jgi:jouberin
MKRPYDPRTPAVLLEFNWARKEQYPSFLEIEVGFCQKSDVEIVRKHFARAPWEKEVGLVSYDTIESILSQPLPPKQEDDIDKIKLLKRWEKFVDLPSELPDLKIWKFETEALGAFKLKFSNRGKYLAAACTMASSKTIVKIFDVENGELKIVLRGHHDLIHDIQWSLNDNYLITTSADCSVKVWNLT